MHFARFKVNGINPEENPPDCSTMDVQICQLFLSNSNYLLSRIEIATGRQLILGQLGNDLYCQLKAVSDFQGVLLTSYSPIWRLPVASAEKGLEPSFELSFLGVSFSPLTSGGGGFSKCLILPKWQGNPFGFPYIYQPNGDSTGSSFPSSSVRFLY